MKTVVRIPGPSSVDMRWISSTMPVVVSLSKVIKSLYPVVAHAGDHLVLQFLAHSDEVRVVAGDTHQ